MGRMVPLPKGLLTETVRVAVVQIDCELVIDTSICSIELKHPKAQKYKIQDALEEVAKQEVDLAVLPEYSTSEEMVPLLQRAADKFGYILIGGSYHDRFRKQNVCPICIPCRETEYCGKKALAAFETILVKPSAEIGGHIHWKSGRKSYCIQVYLCLDYLTTPMYQLGLLDARRTGIVVVPACSTHLRDFYNLACIHLRHEKGKFVLIANSSRTTVAYRTHSGISKPKLISSGKSAIWGSSPGGRQGTPFLSFEKHPDVQGILACTLNLENPKCVVTKPATVYRHCNSPPMSNPSKFYLEPVLKRRGPLCQPPAPGLAQGSTLTMGIPPSAPAFHGT